MYNKQCIFKVYKLMNFYIHVHLRNHHYNQDDILIMSKSLLITFCNLSLPPHSYITTDLFSVTIHLFASSTILYKWKHIASTPSC